MVCSVPSKIPVPKPLVPGNGSEGGHSPQYNPNHASMTVHGMR